MLRRSCLRSKAYRPYYNLATTQPGRMMTGFMTPYRHWMWKQNELWRNVHEAQFEHLRRVYRRQWLESFRVNADEYIYKYNITKAAQLAQWEHEMHDQEAKRKETLQTAQGRQQLKTKHMDLLREYHERHFFYWYERASERLQYMTQIQYVDPNRLDEHIDNELDKYVAGKSRGYPLNFVGQLPLLEDGDGNVVEVPAELMANHMAEHPNAPATTYAPPQVSGDDALRGMISGIDEVELNIGGDVSALAAAIDDIAKEEDQRSEEVKVALSMEQTEDDRAIARQKYINRGNVGSKNVYRKARGDAPPPPSAKAPLRKPKKLDDVHRKAFEQDAQFAQRMKKYAKDDLSSPDVKVGEIRAAPKGRMIDRINLPTMDEVLAIPQMREGNLNIQPKTQGITDKMFGRGKNKPRPKGGDDDDHL